MTIQEIEFKATLPEKWPEDSSAYVTHLNNVVDCITELREIIIEQDKEIALLKGKSHDHGASMLKGLNNIVDDRTEAGVFNRPEDQPKTLYNGTSTES